MGFLFLDNAPFDDVRGVALHQPVHQAAGADQPDLRQVHRQERPPFPGVESPVFKQAVEGFGTFELFGQLRHVELRALELFHRLDGRRNGIGVCREPPQLWKVLRGKQILAQAVRHAVRLPSGDFGSEERHLAELFELLSHKAVYPQIVEVFA